MRLALIGTVESRAGDVDKDPRMTNMLIELDESPMTAVRPGLSTTTTVSGNGNGLFSFVGVPVSVFGTAVGVTSSASSVGTVENKRYDFAVSS